MGTDRTRYGYTGQALHWAIVGLLILQFTLAYLAEDLPQGLDRVAMFARHKSVGITILGIAVVRLLWRLRVNPPPPPPMSRWQLLAARANHAAFYAILLVMPITGWLVSSTGGKPVNWFGLVQLPDLVGIDEAWHERLEQTHVILSRVLIGLAILHVVAALKHQFIDRDGLLFRMLPWRPR